MKASALPKTIKSTYDSFRALGIVFIAVGGFFALYLLLFSPGVMSDDEKGALCLLIPLVVLGCLLLFAAHALVNRKSWSRLAGVLLSIVTLAAFPIGTIFGLVWLWRLLGSEAQDWVSGRPIEDEQAGSTESEPKLRRTRLQTLLLLAIVGVVLLLFLSLLVFSLFQR